MKRILHLFCFCFVSSTMFAQNLVPNASFDTSALSPNYYGQICYPTGWSSPSGYCTVVVNHGSPDYYKIGGTGGAGVPTTFWASVSPHSGAGMAGFGTYLPSYTNFREYVRTTLTSPLVVGETYEVSFWLTNGITWLNGHATNNIGAAFTTAPLTQPAAATIAETPEVEYTSLLWDTLWHQLSFTFVATEAAQYMTIGNFRYDAENIIADIKPVCCPTSSAAYYYIDDVVVQLYTPLPLELLKFSGTEINQTSLLSWITMNEINTSHFIVERSIDGTMFEKIGEVRASENSIDSTHYYFTDDAPAHGINYYRLKQVDINGDYQFSQVIQLYFHSDQQLTILPNPATDEISFGLPQESAGMIEIYNQAGQKVKVYTSGGNEFMQLNVSNLSPGIYFVQFISEQSRITGRFLKL